MRLDSERFYNLSLVIDALPLVLVLSIFKTRSGSAENTGSVAITTIEGNTTFV